MFKEIHQDNDLDGDLAFDEGRTFDLRSTIGKSIDLPAEVLGADFSQVHDRILDQEFFSVLIRPSTSDIETDDWRTRRRDREKALVPYLGKRLVCVCIQLPGIVYTIEIDPKVDKVVHWEWQST